MALAVTLAANVVIGLCKAFISETPLKSDIFPEKYVDHVISILAAASAGIGFEPDITIPNPPGFPSLTVLSALALIIDNPLASFAANNSPVISSVTENNVVELPCISNNPDPLTEPLPINFRILEFVSPPVKELDIIAEPE